MAGNLREGATETMGRKPLAPEVMRQRGAYDGPNANRENKNRPKSDGVDPDRPDWFDETENQKWDEICADLQRMGVQTSENRELLVAYVSSYGGWMRVRKQIMEEGLTHTNTKGTESRHPLLVELHKFKATMIKLLPEFGLTPSSRGKLVSFKDPEKTDAGDILQRLGINNN